MSYFEHDDALRSMVRRARLLKVDDSGSQQLVHIRGLAGDEPKKVFRPQDHGFTSNPPANSDGIALALGGRSDRLVYFDGGHEKHRLKGLPTGGVALYDADGKVLKFHKDKSEWDAGAKPIEVTNVKTFFVTATEKIKLIVGGTTITITPSRVDLGGEGGPAVVTTAGPSSVVFAKV